MITVLIAQVCHAQEPYDSFPVDVGEEGQPPPELTAQQLEQVLEFRAKHLELRAFETGTPGLTWISPGWGRRGTWMPGTVMTTPPDIREEWVVYQGPRQLEVPEYLRAVGRDSEADALTRRIRGNRGVGGVFGTLAVLGLAGGVGGISASLLDDPANRDQWTTVGLSSFGGALFTVILASAAGSRADKLETDYSKSQQLDQVEVNVRAYNEGLREDLGLTADQVYRELRPRR